MIAQFNRPRGWSLAGMTLSVALAAIALTGAVRGQQQTPPPTDATVPGAGPSQPGAGPSQRQMGGVPGTGGVGSQNAAPRMPKATRGIGAAPPADPAQTTAPPTEPATPGGPGLPGAAGTGGGYRPPPGAGIGAAAPAANTGDMFSGLVEGPEAARADSKSIDRLHKAFPASFQNVPLNEALNYVADQTGVDFFTDSKAMEQEGIAADAPVNLQLRQPLPGDEVLRLILRSAGGDGLGYGILHGVVYVTTQSHLENSRVTRAFDVSDFENQEDQLQRAVMRTIAPGSWDTNGGSGSVLVLGHKMIVTAAEPNQREIAKLLELLRDNEPARRTQTAPGAKSDAGPEHKIFRLRFADAQAIGNQIAAILGILAENEKGWQLVPDTSTNSVLVVAPPALMARIQSLMFELDKQQQDKPLEKPTAPDRKPGTGPASATLQIPHGQAIDVPADMQDELRQLWESKYANRMIRDNAGKDFNRQKVEDEFRQEVAQHISARAARQAADGSAQKASQ
jgi:hypothetical protein